MNTIGIDYQRTLSVICLREGPCSTAKIRSIGDGQCRLIPNAIQGEHLWGSRALQHANVQRLWDTTLLSNDSCLDEEGASLFWKGAYQRLYAYLGRTEPTPPNGYRTIVSIQTESFADTAEHISQHCNAAKLIDPTVISAVDAVLFRWLAEQKKGRRDEQVIAAVAVGDTTISVRGYRIQQQERDYPRILAASQTLFLNEVGQAWWINDVLKLVEEHMNGQLPIGQELGLRNAAIDLGAQLGRIAAHDSAVWTGPFQSYLFEPLQLTRLKCASWNGIMQMTSDLPAIIKKVISSITHTNDPDILLLGGIGAVWPFAKDAVATSIDPKITWQSNTPEEDVAWGAACFPEVGEPYVHILHELPESVPAWPLPNRDEDNTVLITPFTGTTVNATPFQSSLLPLDEVYFDPRAQSEPWLPTDIAVAPYLHPNPLLSDGEPLAPHFSPVLPFPDSPGMVLDTNLQDGQLPTGEAALDFAIEPGSLFSVGVTLDPRLQPDPSFSVSEEDISEPRVQLDPLMGHITDASPL